ncbi:MAG: preQ(1) synthase [Acidaminococcales bacterium]|jgi:7-cyano-7-deazaguanine reductase|nr:preQ(1) synthase [Acidaminococcales bacterium]
MAGRKNPRVAGLKALGAPATRYKDNYDPGLLECFDNKNPQNDYFVRFNCPEFTSLCPLTGQPDFAAVYISYVPDKKLVESKSLKLYLFSFRNHGDFHEDCVNIIMKDLITLLEPKYIEVWGCFAPRGGISIDPYCNYGRPGSEWSDVALNRLHYHDAEKRRGPWGADRQ